LRAEGLPLSKSVIYGILSGIVEPVAAVITLLLTNVVVSILPYLLAFAAGAMIYVVVEELIPESQTGPHSNVEHYWSSHWFCNYDDSGRGSGLIFFLYFSDVL